MCLPPSTVCGARIESGVFGVPVAVHIAEREDLPSRQPVTGEFGGSRSRSPVDLHVSLLERVVHFGVDLNTAILALRDIAGHAECVRRGPVGELRRSETCLATRSRRIALPIHW